MNRHVRGLVREGLSDPRGGVVFVERHLIGQQFSLRGQVNMIAAHCPDHGCLRPPPDKNIRSSSAEKFPPANGRNP